MYDFSFIHMCKLSLFFLVVVIIFLLFTSLSGICFGVVWDGNPMFFAVLLSGICHFAVWSMLSPRAS